MTAARGSLRAPRQRGRRASVLAGAAALIVVAGAGAGAAFAAVNWPAATLLGLAVVVVLGVVLSRVDVAVAVLAATFFFNAYVNHGVGILTLDKGIGLLVVGAWALDWAVNRRAILVTRQLWLIGAFLLWSAVSIAVAVNDKAALVTWLRYATFAALYFLVVQMVRGERRRADVLVSVMVVAATVAGIIGLAAFFGHHVARASGPISDPNDFGFVLASTVPLAVYQVRWAASRWSRAIWCSSLAVILACTLATFSRSALVGLSMAGVWALATGRLRLRWFVGVLACLGAIVGVAMLTSPQVVETAFGAKAHVAIANVDVRSGYYKVEVDEFAHYPITGVGPGNFVYRFFQFEPGVHETLPFPSHVTTISGEEAYLVILAEQGGVGLALFLAYLFLSWTDLRRRFPNNRRDDQLQSALAAGFVVACVGALFLAEQYYAPMWFLPAVAASLAGGIAGKRGGRERGIASGPAEASFVLPTGP